MKRIVLVIILFLLLVGIFSCKDPLPPKIDPYQFLRTGWSFVPNSLKYDTLLVDLRNFSGPITIFAYLVNEWDEWIVDTSYVDVHIRMTLLKDSTVTDDFYIVDTTQNPLRLTLNDSIRVSMQWNHRLHGKTVWDWMGNPIPNQELNRFEWKVARIRLSGEIRLFKNVLPKALPEKEILIFYIYSNLG